MSKREGHDAVRAEEEGAARRDARPRARRPRRGRGPAWADRGRLPRGQALPGGVPRGDRPCGGLPERAGAGRGRPARGASRTRRPRSCARCSTRPTSRAWRLRGRRGRGPGGVLPGALLVRGGGPNRGVRLALAGGGAVLRARRDGPGCLRSALGPRGRPAFAQTPAGGGAGRARVRGGQRLERARRGAGARAGARFRPEDARHRRVHPSRAEPHHPRRGAGHARHPGRGGDRARPPSRCTAWRTCCTGAAASCRRVTWPSSRRTACSPTTSPACCRSSARSPSRRSTCAESWSGRSAAPCASRPRARVLTAVDEGVARARPLEGDGRVRRRGARVPRAGSRDRVRGGGPDVRTAHAGCGLDRRAVPRARGTRLGGAARPRGRERGLRAGVDERRARPPRRADEAGGAPAPGRHAAREGRAFALPALHGRARMGRRARNRAQAHGGVGGRPRRSRSSRARSRASSATTASSTSWWTRCRT